MSLTRLAELLALYLLAHPDKRLARVTVREFAIWAHDNGHLKSERRIPPAENRAKYLGSRMVNVESGEKV